ncbi:MAG: preprotein translocase subunit SecG [Candidatus Hydrothermia bacterium]
MYSFISVIYVLLVLVMIVVILMQEPRESGFSPSMGGMQQLLGVKGIPTFFTRLTWALGVVFMVFSLILSATNPAQRMIRRSGGEEATPIQKRETEMPQQMPELPGGGR